VSGDIAARYVPDAGHVVWLEFHPQRGHEQAGRRPALVLSRADYNDKTSLAVVCPITNEAKGYPFEVAVGQNPNVTGVVLSDHVKSLDWRARKAEHKGTVDASVIEQARRNIAALIGM
jgi:mRNA interferase MazF